MVDTKSVSGPEETDLLSKRNPKRRLKHSVLMSMTNRVIRERRHRSGFREGQVVKHDIDLDQLDIGTAWPPGERTDSEGTFYLEGFILNNSLDLQCIYYRISIRCLVEPDIAAPKPKPPS